LTSNNRKTPAASFATKQKVRIYLVTPAEARRICCIRVVLVRNRASFSASSTKPLVIISVRACVGWVREHAFMNGKIGIYRSLALQHPFGGVVVKKTGFPAGSREQTPGCCTPVYTLNAHKHTPQCDNNRVAAKHARLFAKQMTDFLCACFVSQPEDASDGKWSDAASSCVCHFLFSARRRHRLHPQRNPFLSHFAERRARNAHQTRALAFLSRLKCTFN
jgi:hypothetical protein